jgi:hypothetical protein
MKRKVLGRAQAGRCLGCRVTKTGKRLFRMVTRTALDSKEDAIRFRNETEMHSERNGKA